MKSLESVLKLKVRGMIHNIQAKYEKKIVNNRLANYDPSVIQNKALGQVKSILFVIERMALHSGGQTSILRLGTQLSNLGYDVSYSVYKKQSKEAMEEIASKNLRDYKGNMYTRNELKELNPDVIIASSWDTVSFVKKFSGYKMYFVQDYEPYFFAFGELFMLAKKTYEQGLHMVSLGDWNKQMIEGNCNIVSSVDRIDFPYEKKEYPLGNRNYNSYKDKNEFNIAVYLKYYGKRLPNITQYLMTELKEEFKKDGITLNLTYFGEDKSFQVEGGVNAGLLNKDELYQLYKKSDFGFVVSLSNISLVPYEMIATGLPIVEFEDGTFPYFFPEGSAILTGLSAKELHDKMKIMIDNTDEITKMMELAMGHLSKLSWEKTGQQFHEILKEIIQK